MFYEEKGKDIGHIFSLISIVPHIGFSVKKCSIAFPCNEDHMMPVDAVNYGKVLFKKKILHFTAH